MQAVAVLTLLPVPPTRRRGRPRLVDCDSTLQRCLDAAAFRARGKTVTEIAGLYGVSRPTVHNWLSAARAHACDRPYQPVTS